MADRKFINWLEHKQPKSSRVAVHSTGIDMQLYDFKRVNKMGQVKILWLICDIFGIPITLLGIVANLDNIKSAILAILGITYLMIRSYFYVIKSNQSVRDKELDLWHKEQDKQERISKMSKQEK